MNQELAKAFLENAGHQVQIVENGLEAVEAAQSRLYDVIIMDVHMPVLDGMDATKKIRQISGEHSNVPIIGLSADTISGDREMYMSGGMNDYVSKPYRMKELIQEISRCCHK